MGRSVELSAVADLLSSARVEPSRLLLEGESGIGKTTVWSTALELAREEGFQVLSTRPAASESVLAYASLADMLAGVDAAHWADLPAPQQLALDRVLLRANADGGATDPRAVAAGFLSVVERLATQSPVLLAVDDMQWLDSSSEAALTFAVRRLCGHVAFLGAARVDSVGSSGGTLVRLGESEQLRRVRLCPFDLAGTRAVVSQATRRSFARPTMVRIHEISGGNPFFALELAHAIDDEQGPLEMPLPATLSELVRTRIRELNSDAYAALLAAASVSSPTVELVAKAVGSTTEIAVELLESTAVKEIVTVRGAAVRFTHPLMAWGVYTDADPGARRMMHRRLSAVVDEPELRARHLALAATGPDEETLQSLDTAAELARHRGAPAAAAELIELAIALGADSSQRRILLARNQFTAGDSAQARVQLDRVVAGSVPDAVRAEALTLLAVLSLTDGSWVAGAELLEQAFGEALGDLALRVRILIPWALAQLNGGQFEAAARTIADAVADATGLGDDQLLSQALSMRVIVDFLRGNGVDNELLSRAVALERRDPPIWVQLRPTVHCASLLGWTGQHDAAHDRFLAIRQDLIERGEESELMFVAFTSVLNEIWRADFATARAVVADALERAMHLNGVLPLGVALMLQATLDAYAGRELDARRHIDEATEAINHSGSHYLIAWLGSASGFLEVSLGDYESALRIFEPALARIMKTPRSTEIFVAGFVPDAVEALVHLGRLDDAEPVIRMIEDNGSRLDRAWMLATGARCRAMLLAARGDVDAAEKAVERALREHERLPMPFERARSLLLLGQIQRRRRAKDAAAATLREALDVFEELGTPLWVDRAQVELARAKTGARPTAELTPSERRVAELLASGMTRREVAAALFISPKTVEASLTRIYRKLGIHSRAELGRYMANP
ncbi:helix-turn-helix transcriptional regulator [Mycolicibacterium stellerae]|uniref:helix-turn-helix transcriptional regulator n=1 Tax=Mycolicibacterium stellerae TaxID=2358193 RepID=UPI001F45A054|nr:LuxR family transcriptional regulator [Mycolicibacterium stellerae]